MKTVQGNLIDMAERGEFDIIIHGANIHNTMGSGIAGEIRRRIPSMVEVDSMTVAGDIRKLGTFTLADTGFVSQTGNPDFYTVMGVNLYTQATIGKPGNNVDYDGLARGLYQLNLMFIDFDVQPKIGIPKIGAGLGGGDWTRIRAIIESIGFKDITYVEFTG